MGVFFYNIFLSLFRAGTLIASLFNKKAKKWVAGRKNIFQKLEATIDKDHKVIWIHCASLGEFEQGRPIIEKLKSLNTGHKILLTFFSPSGFEAQKNYPLADWIFYLPIDGPKNAKQFLQIVNPALVIFVKYEFWYYYLKKIKYRNIPLLLVSALFRKDMSFFKWYGGLQRKMLSRFDHIFVQNQSSKKLIDQLGLSDICSVSGDTRFDRVIEITQKANSIPLIEKFTSNYKVIVAGSTWPEDEVALKEALSRISYPGLKLILAPHEINEKHIREVENLFPDAIRFSKLDDNRSMDMYSTLIIDNIGMLSRLYQYAYIAYVGGGLRTNGVHNVLEAAVYDKVVLFGNYYHKYSEAIGLVQSGGGIPFYNQTKDGVMLSELINALLENEDDYKERCMAAGDFVRSGKGATGKVIEFIQEKRLLTN